MELKNYENSTLRKKFCLNGLWDFSADSTGIDTLPENWDETKIKVPSPYNINSFTRSHYRNTCGEKLWVQGGDFRLYPEYPAEWENAKCGFYKRSVFIGEEFSDQRIFLHYDAVAFHCFHYINGVKVAETMEAFLPLDIEITDYVKFGCENEIITACESAGYLMYKGKDGRNRLDYPRGSFWGEHVSGIWQDCWLVVRPKAYIDDIFAVSDVYKRELDIKFASDNADGCSVRFYLKKWNTDEEKREICSSDSASGEVIWSWKEDEVDLWDVREPNLYELTGVLMKDDAAVDEKTIRIGFRTMRADGEKFVLNGRRINLKIDAWHYMGYTIQSPEYARAYYRMAFDAGVNIIRLHAEPFPEFFIDVADEMGMLIVAESAVWASHCAFSYSPDFFKNSTEHLVHMLLRDRNHPSVVMWSPENECIPAYMFCGSDYVKSIPELEEKIYDFLKVTYDYDTSRLISCDGSGDLGGRLPVNSLHYCHYDCPTHRGKPITIGEMGSMYYSNPDTITKEFGREAIDTFDGRLQSVADDAYHDLIGQRKWASQICVFNLIWYGLNPMPFEDRLLQWDDYTTPGVKLSRVTKYMRTLNAGLEPSLPDYLPNPVWKTVRDAYIPTRSFGEKIPEYVWAGEEAEFNVTTFNDYRDDCDFILSVTVSFKNEEITKEKALSIKACEYSEDKFSFNINKAKPFALKLALKTKGETVHECEYQIKAIDKKAYAEAFQKTNVKLITDGDIPENTAVIDCRRVKPYSDFIKPTDQQHFFDGEFSVKYPTPVKSGVFEDCLSFGAIPVLTDGTGAAVAVDLCCAGEKRIVCALNLDNEKPESAVIKLRLAEKLASETAAEVKKPYYYGDASSNTAAMLTELGCEFDLVTEEELRKMLHKKQNRLLIIDGSAEFDDYELIGAQNFEKVLVMSPKKAPRFISNEMEITDRKLFQLTAKNGADGIFGLTSNALYGCEINREVIVADKTIVYKGNDMSDILLGVPNIDWRAWNNVGEPIKTVAIHRTEQRDDSRCAALAMKKHSGSEIYISTVAAGVDSPKLKNIWARVLSYFNVEMEMKQNDEISNILFSGIYSGYVRKMLVRPASENVNHVEDAANAAPGLNYVENGKAWKICKDGERENALYGFYVTSPQDRRDLLLNPDFIDMSIEADAKAEVYLGGEKIGEGEKFDITGIPLDSGVNKIVIHISGKSKMPVVKFRRVKKPALDLTFGLFPGELKPVSMQGVKYFANTNDQYSSHASFTREHFWSTNKNQEKGIYLDFSFPEKISMRALWFVAIKFHNEGEDYTPRAFKLYAGEDSEHLAEVYSSLSEKHMSYPRGRVFVDFGKTITAKSFRFELDEEAGKEFVMSDLTLFS